MARRHHVERNRGHSVKTPNVIKATTDERHLEIREGGGKLIKHKGIY